MAAPEPAPRPPRIARDGLGFRFEPSDAPVTLTFSRIVERRDELTAEIHVQTRGSGPPGHVLRRRVNLLGSRTPADLSRDLDAATDAAGWPWRKIIESAFASVIESHRAGDEVRLLGGKRQAPPLPSHLIPGLILRDTANTWFGPGGTGKSTAAVAACVAHKLGLPFLGETVPRGEPLYCDWEDEDDAFDRNLWAVSRGYGLEESAQIYWRRMKLPLASEIAYVSALIDRLRITLVVIDSATRAMGSAGEHGTYESTAIAFAEAIRALGKVTILIIDHVDGAAVKEGGPAKKAYGSIHKLNFVRNAWSVTLDDEASEQTVGWTHAKVNYVKKRPPFGMRYERDEVTGDLRLELIDAGEVQPLVEKMTLRARIASLLGRHGVLSVKDIALEIKGSAEKKDTETIRKTLDRDLGKRFRTYSDGTWSLRDFRATSTPDNQTRRPDIRLVTAGEDLDELPF